MTKKNKRHNGQQQQSPERSDVVQSKHAPAPAIPPTVPQFHKQAASLLSAWGQFLTPIATILMLVFAAYQAWLTEKKEELAVLTLNTAERASALAIQSSNLTERAKAELQFLTLKQQELEGLTQISTLSIRAENGDRSALATLFALTPDTKPSFFNHGSVSLAKKNIDRIAHRFDTMTFDDPAFLEQISIRRSMGSTQDSIDEALHHTNFITRSQAALNVSYLRVNKLIPTLYERARTEPDLHVLNVMCYSLNQLLDPFNKPFFPSQFVFYPEWASNEYARLWFPTKETLLAQSQKKWIPIEPREGSPWNTMLIDPDTQDERTGQPKGQ